MGAFLFLRGLYEVVSTAGEKHHAKFSYGAYLFVRGDICSADGLLART